MVLVILWSLFAHVYSFSRACLYARQCSIVLTMVLRPVLICSLCAGVLAAADAWPQFRGPAAGIADDKELPETWSATENVAWKTDIPGRGWSSPVGAADRGYLSS